MDDITLLLSENDLKCFLAAIKRARRDHDLGTHAQVTLHLTCTSDGHVSRAALHTSSPFVPETPIPLVAALEDVQSA